VVASVIVNEWIKNVAIAVLSLVIIDIIITSGETKKYIKGVASLFVLMAMITPLANIKNIKFDLTSDSEKITTNVLDNDYLAYIYEARRHVLEKSVLKALEQEGISDAIVNVIVGSKSDLFEIENIYINIKKPVIKQNDENNIIIDQIKKRVREVLLVDEKLIVIHINE
jgi:stage III sporulation protein AF